MRKITLHYCSPTNEERAAIEAALKGEPKRDELEKKFCRYVSSEYAVATCSETSALHLAMMAIDLKRGDKILCSVNSYVNVPEAVRHFDAEPIFVDIDQEDYNINLDELEKILAKNRSKKLKAAIITHVAGQAADLDRIYDIAERYEIMIIEDANDALGAYYKGQKIGSYPSIITTFSFNPHRANNLSNGAVLTTHDEEIHDRARLLSNNALITSDWSEEGELGYIYDVVDIGLEYGMSDLDAAFSLVRLQRNDAAITRRQEIAKIYYKELADIPHIELPVQKRDHIFSKFIIKVDKNRDSFARELYKRGIETGLHYIPLHLLSYYKQKYNLRVNDFPNALRNYQQILSIPIHEGMSDEDVYYVCEQIKEVAKSRV